MVTFVIGMVVGIVLFVAIGTVLLVLWGIGNNPPPIF